ncbi:hypothetical protein F5Y15DRAFT_416745 [Xylariaceae sp. FL0016]|nr:hypothetical protein F5Y15DRAFT_416745 [Xylariaceae sp. FL0016]
MHHISLSLLLLSSLTTLPSSIHATPLKPTNSLPQGSLLPLRTAILTDGKTLTWYAAGPASSPNATDIIDLLSTAPPPPDDCGSADLTCDDENIPSEPMCAALLDIIASPPGDDDGDETVPQGSLALCLSLTGSTPCCITWSAAVPGMRRRDLLPAARKTQRGCVERGLSGLARSVEIEGACVVQCLSNRSDPCK